MRSLWRLILRWLGLDKPPGSVTEIRITDMATTRTITWTLPAVGSRQRPLDRTQIDFRVKVTSGTPLPWTTQDDVDAGGEQKLVIADPAPGTFEYQFTVFDVDGVAGPAVVVEKTSAAEPPGSVMDVQIVDA